MTDAAQPPLPLSSAIAYVAGEFPLRSETFVYREVRELRRRGQEVVCVTLRPPGDPPTHADDLQVGVIAVYGPTASQTLRQAACELATHPWRSLRTLAGAHADALWPGEKTSWASRIKLPIQAFVALGLARTLRARKVRHVHAHFAHAPTTLAAYAAKQLDLPFSFTGHANDLFQRRALLRRKLERAAFVACISQWHREFYSAVVPRGPEHYPIVRCGVDTSEFSAVVPRNDAERLHVLSVARLVEKKGFDMLIRALHALDSSAQSWALTIAGDGPQREALHALVDELNLRSGVRFLGAVDNGRVQELMGEHDLFVLPCRVDAAGDKDGIPVVLMEAMARAVPVISGDLDAIRELVEHDVAGLLVDGQSVESIRSAIARVAGDAALRARLGAGGRARILEEFSLAANVSRLQSACAGAATD